MNERELRERIALQHHSMYRSRPDEHAIIHLHSTHSVAVSCLADLDPENPPLCFLYEKYDDADAFASHLASDHFHQFDSTVADWIDKKEVRTWTLHVN